MYMDRYMPTGMCLYVEKTSMTTNLHCPPPPPPPPPPVNIKSWTEAASGDHRDVPNLAKATTYDKNHIRPIPSLMRYMRYNNEDICSRNVTYIKPSTLRVPSLIIFHLDIGWIFVQASTFPFCSMQVLTWKQPHRVIPRQLMSRKCCVVTG